MSGLDELDEISEPDYQKILDNTASEFFTSNPDGIWVKEQLELWLIHDPNLRETQLGLYQPLAVTQNRLLSLLSATLDGRDEPNEQDKEFAIKNSDAHLNGMISMQISENDKGHILDIMYTPLQDDDTCFTTQLPLFTKQGY